MGLGTTEYVAPESTMNSRPCRTSGLAGLAISTARVVTPMAIGLLDDAFGLRTGDSRRRDEILASPGPTGKSVWRETVVTRAASSWRGTSSAARRRDRVARRPSAP